MEYTTLTLLNGLGVGVGSVGLVVGVGVGVSALVGVGEPEGFTGQVGQTEQPDGVGEGGETFKHFSFSISSQ